MKHHYFTYFALFTCLFSTAQNVDIADDQFKNYLLTKLSIDSNNDKEISVQEAAAYNGEINIRNNHKIVTLSGIEAFINLTSLDCSATYIDYLDVSKNTALITLRCGPSKISVLDLRTNTALQELVCPYVPITALDLRYNTDLTYLDCSRDSLISLDLSHNPKLTRVNCGYNKLNNLMLGQHNDLEWFDCNTNLLTSLQVQHAPLLKMLNCSKNKLSTLDVSQNTALMQLQLSSNLLSSIDVSKNINMTQLLLDKNKMTQLDVEMNSALKTLACQSNQLTQLNLKNQHELTELYCQDNILGPILDISSCNRLGFFSCINMPTLKTICVFDTVIAHMQFLKDSAATWSYDCTIGIHNYSIHTMEPAYPNPFVNDIHLGKEHIGSLYNATGEQVIRFQKEVIHGEQLPSGVYYLIRIDRNGKQVSQKLIKQ